MMMTTLIIASVIQHHQRIIFVFVQSGKRQHECSGSFMCEIEFNDDPSGRILAPLQENAV